MNASQKFRPVIQLKYTKGPGSAEILSCFLPRNSRQAVPGIWPKRRRRMFAVSEQARCHTVLWRLGEGHVWWVLTHFRSWHEMCWVVMDLSNVSASVRLTEEERWKCESTTSVYVKLPSGGVSGMSENENDCKLYKIRILKIRWCSVPITVWGGPFHLFSMNVKTKWTLMNACLNLWFAN